eukprot:8640398-Prorocentrum_lima.AAC.1
MTWHTRRDVADLWWCFGRSFLREGNLFGYLQEHGRGTKIRRPARGESTGRYPGMFRPLHRFVPSER